MHYSYPVHSQALGILLKYYPIIQGQVGLWTCNLQFRLCHTGIPPSCARPRTAAERQGLSATWQRGASVVEGGEARTAERWSVPFFNRTGNATVVRILLRGVSPPEVGNLFNAAFFTARHNDGTDRGVTPKRRNGKKRRRRKKSHPWLPRHCHLNHGVPPWLMPALLSSLWG